MTQNMVIGISHRVVKYSVVQKIAELVANHYLKQSTFAQSFRLFDDSVTPTYKVRMISHLHTRAHLPYGGGAAE